MRAPSFGVTRQRVKPLGAGRLPDLVVSFAFRLFARLLFRITIKHLSHSAVLKERPG
jgi:hypothetical protein